MSKANLLENKIQELEIYIYENYPERKPKIQNFLKDLKSIQSNLSILELLNHLVEMHRDGHKTIDIIEDVRKTKKIFQVAQEYLKSVEEDIRISSLSEEIHQIISKHLEQALELYQREYDIPASTR